MIHKLEELLDSQIRPALADHGGGVEIVDFENNKLFVKMSGGCQGCASSTATLKDGIKRAVQQKYPIIEDVIDVTDHSQGQNPYYK